MADNYLEYARENYEQRKAVWLAKQSHAPKKKTTTKPKDHED